MTTASLLLAAAVALAACGGTSSGTPSAPTSRSVCAKIPTARVARLVDRASGGHSPRLHATARGTELLVQCRYNADGVKVGVTLDRARDARQRWDNRIVETAQFSATTPNIFPRPVRGVGDPRAGNEGAQWVPGFNQLLAYRRGQYLVVDFTVEGAGDGADRKGATKLALLAFPRLPR
jgi:hypothetical protein